MNKRMVSLVLASTMAVEENKKVAKSAELGDVTSWIMEDYPNIAVVLNCGRCT